MALLEWRFEQHDGTVADRVRLDADGTILRLLTHPGAGTAPEVGWWAGRLGDGPGAAAAALAERDWSEVSAGVPPAVAGRWLVSRGDGAVLPLDASSPDDLTGQLSAVRGAVLDAATEAVHVARLTAAWRAIGDDPLPLLDLASVGSATVSMQVKGAADDDVAAFLNDDAETVGFLGDRIALEPGTHAFALLRVAAGDGGLVVGGEVAGGEVFGGGRPGAPTLRPGGGGSVTFAAVVEVATPDS